MEKKINAHVDVPKIYSRHFAVEVVKDASKSNLYIIREVSSNGMTGISTYGSFKELCQFFDAL